jgi:predicted dienelactone hydrolase
MHSLMKTLLTWLAAALLILLAAAWLLLRFALQPEPFPSGSESARWLQPGSLPVARQDLSLIDASRPRPANREAAGAPVRTLETTVWFPETGGPYPLIVHSHGFTSNRGNGHYLGRYLASHGYVVAMADHPLTHFMAPGGPNVRDVVHQPGDVSFLIDSLTGAAEAPLPEALDPALVERVDAGRIGVMGISLGGLTATLVGFHPSLADPRVDAALSIAGPTVFFTPRFFQTRRLPFLMLAGEDDALVPFGSNAAPIPEKVPGGQLLSLASGSHTGFSGGTALLRWMRNPDAIGCWSVERNLDLDADSDWGGLLGDASEGIDTAARIDLCTVEPLPRTMHVFYQQNVARVAVRAFFDSVLAPDAGRRMEAARFLRSTLARELPAVSYRGS